MQGPCLALAGLRRAAPAEIITEGRQSEGDDEEDSELHLGRSPLAMSQAHDGDAGPHPWARAPTFAAFSHVYGNTITVL